MTKKVMFMSRKQAELLDPFPGSAVISISDDPDYPAKLKSGWSHVMRIEFIDAAYDEVLVSTYGYNSPIFSSYFNKDQALNIQKFIQTSIEKGIHTFVVHCYAGKSRSAAVAKFLVDTMSFELVDQLLKPRQYRELSEFNPLVYQLLTNPHYFDHLSTAHQNQPNNSLFSKFVSFFKSNK